MKKSPLTKTVKKKKSPKSVPKAVSKSFRGRLERMGSGLKWVIVRIPVDVPAVWGTRGMLKVKVELNGCAFRTSLFPTKSGQHFLLVNKKMQAKAQVAAGSMVNVRLEPDTAPRTLTVSGELDRALSQDRALRRWFEKLNYSARKDITDWVSQAKRAETREHRAQQMAERLLAAMEAEVELPPVIRAAFAQNPVARGGWQHMTPRQRRGELLAIFYYRNPESRNRRLEKTVQMAAELMAKVKEKMSKKRT